MKPVRKLRKSDESPSEFTCWKCEHIWKEVYVPGKIYLCPECKSHKVTRKV